MALEREPIKIYQVELGSTAELPTVPMYAGVSSSDILGVQYAVAYDNYAPEDYAGDLGDEAYYVHPSLDKSGNAPIGCLDLSNGGIPCIMGVFEDEKGKYVFKDLTTTSEQQYIEGTLKARANVAASVAFEFLINPHNIDVGKTKHNTKIRTRKGFEFQYWGAEITTISLQGVTGNLLRSTTGAGATDSAHAGTFNTGEVSIYETPAYQAFKQLEALYDVDHQDESISANTLLALVYRDRTYIGHFDSFSFQEVAEKPFHFAYTIKFSVQDEPTTIASTALAQQYAVDADTITTLKSLAGVSKI
jgi:hypothetical protein